MSHELDVEDFLMQCGRKNSVSKKLLMSVGGCSDEEFYFLREEYL